MKKFIPLLFLTTPAFAYLPSSAFSTNQLSVYGFYTTSDPTCQTGLVATLPLSKTGATADFSGTPVLGSGSVSSPINCAIMVVQAKMNVSWRAGSYTGTQFGFSDSACNGGGSLNQYFCSNGMGVNWPAQIQADAAAVGLNLTTSCADNATDIVPVYLSTDSACYMNVTLDGATAPCWSGSGPYTPSTNPFQHPTAAADALHGLKLSAPPAAASSLTFGVNIGYMMGGISGSCMQVFPPVFTFHN